MGGRNRIRYRHPRSLGERLKKPFGGRGKMENTASGKSKKGGGKGIERKTKLNAFEPGSVGFELGRQERLGKGRPDGKDG